MKLKNTEVRRRKSAVGCETEMTKGSGSHVRSLVSDFRSLTSRLHSLLRAFCSLRSLFLSSFLIAVFFVGVALAVEGDIVFKRPGGDGGVPPAVFPHWFHRIRFKCYACHPSIFQMKAGADKITMDAIAQGKFCGTCHNGKIAWNIAFNTCPKCHVGK